MIILGCIYIPDLHGRASCGDYMLSVNCKVTHSTSVPPRWAIWEFSLLEDLVKGGGGEDKELMSCGGIG